MEKPLPFIIQKNGKLELNEEVLKIIENSDNPRLLLFYGATRMGKSTTLNQIIRGNIDTWKYINKEPFKTRSSQASLTEGCDIFGPIKCSEIKRRHNLNIKLDKDFDIFFCDTEGLYSLKGQSRIFIPGILTLLQVATLSVIMTNQAVNENTASQISAEIQFSKILQKINRDLQSPLVAIFISGFLVDVLGINDFDSCVNEYSDECDKVSDYIYDNIKKNNPNLEFKRNEYYKVIPGGPYQQNDDSEPDHHDLKARLYWKYINEIPKQLIFLANKNKDKTYNAKKFVSLIRIVFEFFKDFTELPNDVDLKGALIKYLKDSFNSFSNEQFELINKEIKRDLKNNYDKYYQMLIDNETAKEKLNQCIEKDKYDIYAILIPEEINNFMENAHLKLINSITSQFEEEFKIQSKIITSENYITNHIQFIIDEINKANFQEDINMEIVKKHNQIWDLVDKENEGLFKFFKEKKPIILENLKKNFNNLKEKNIQGLISKKLIWKQFFEERKADIKEEINNQYTELFRNVQYQEDFVKMIKSNVVLSRELFQKYDEKYFRKLPEEKKDEIKNWINQTCEIEYKKLEEDNSKKEKWADITRDLQLRVKEKIKHHIDNAFSGKYFRNDIDPNLGREDAINNVIKDLYKSQGISLDRQQEVKNIFKNEVNSAVNLFKKKREELPKFEDVLLKKEKDCIKLADNKIKELLKHFEYFEDKKNFDQDNFYTLLKQNKEINLNIPQNNMEFDYMIRNISFIKSDEYNNYYAPKKPCWSNIKEKIKQKIEAQCDNFIKEVLGNKSFKQEIKYDIKQLDKKIEALNLFDGISKKKFDEIKELINKKRDETKQRILIQTNSLSDWSIIKQLKINEGKDIMNHKLQSLTTEELNLSNIKQLLIQEVLLYPRFNDVFKNRSDLYNIIINELEKKAEEMAVTYINKKKEEIKKTTENEKALNDLLQFAESEANKRIESEKKFENLINNYNNQIQNLENQISELKNRPQPEPNPPQPQPQPQPPCFPRPNYGGGSIVDALKSIGANSSYDYRCTIAARNGIGGGDYRGRPHENVQMLRMLKEGRLIIP